MQIERPPEEQIDAGLIVRRVATDRGSLVDRAPGKRRVFKNNNFCLINHQHPDGSETNEVYHGDFYVYRDSTADDRRDVTIYRKGKWEILIQSEYALADQLELKYA